MKARRLLSITLVVAPVVSLMACGRTPAPQDGGPSLPTDLSTHTSEHRHRLLVRQGMPDFPKAENPAFAATQLWYRLTASPDTVRGSVESGINDAREYCGEIKKGSFRVVQHESGQALFNKRRLPAGIVKVRFHTIDRLKGEYGDACLIYMTVDDAEFEMERRYSSVFCESAGYGSLQKWREDSGFIRDPGSPVVSSDPDDAVAAPSTVGSRATASAAPATTSAETLQYDPAVSIISGRLELRSFLNDVSGATERQFVLVLARPIAVARGADIDQPETRPVQVVTIVPYRSTDEFAAAVDHNVAVKGKLFAAVTAHHHTPVLLGEAELVRAPNASTQAPTRPPPTSARTRPVTAARPLEPSSRPAGAHADQQAQEKVSVSEPVPTEAAPPVPETRDPIEVQRVEAVYPEAARKARLQGIVIVEGIVTTEGDVRSVRVVRSISPLLDNAALRAAQQYKYKPALRDGKPVPKTVTITTTFKLQ